MGLFRISISFDPTFAPTSLPHQWEKVFLGRGLVSPASLHCDLRKVLACCPKSKTPLAGRLLEASYRSGLSAHAPILLVGLGVAGLPTSPPPCGFRFAATHALRHTPRPLSTYLDDNPEQLSDGYFKGIGSPRSRLSSTYPIFLSFAQVGSPECPQGLTV